MISREQASAPPPPLQDDGEMLSLFRALPWAATPLGPPEYWPRSLHTTAGLVLAAPVGMIVLWGPELVQIYNDAYREVMGSKHPGGLGQPTRECWPEVWDFNAPIYQGVMERGESFTFQDQRLVVERSGAPEEAFFTLSYSPIPDDDDAVGGVLVTVVETTEQVRARGARAAERDRLVREAEAARDAAQRVAAEAAASEQRYRSLFESIDEGFCVIEMIYDDAGRPVDYRFLEGNPEFERQTGLVGALGRTAREMVPSLEAHWFEIYGRVAETGEPVRFQNGSDPMGRWFDVYAFRIGRPEDRRVALLFSDVTAAHEAQQERERLLTELRAERERLRLLILSMPAPLALLVGPEHRFQIVNDAYRRISGGGRDVTGLTPQEAFPELEGQGFYELYDRVYETGEPWIGPEAAVRFDRDGDGVQDNWFDLRLEPICDAEGRVTGILNFAVDVTERVRARRELERLLTESERAREDAEAARAEAEAANQAKSDFLAVMSHELRTPLNAISGYADLLEMGIHGPVTEAQRRALTRIQASQAHLLGLINEVLNYARIETGILSYDLAAVPVSPTISAAEALVAPQIRAKGLDYHFVPGDPALAVRADEEKVRQILLNLLSNALKFTPAGGRISVECSATPGSVAISVADTGRGVPPEKLASIFDPFVQVDARLTRTQEGVGLGLAISRDLARGMGGDLVASSAPGAGSTFTLTLPRDDATPAEPAG